MNRLGKALLAGLILAIAGAGLFMTPYGRFFEEEYGLALLFHLRGPRSHPGRAIIVNIDSESSGKLGYAAHFSDWPRSVHAELIDRLAQYGAAVIVFDIFFGEKRETLGDRQLAEAIRRAGNVVLVEDLQHRSLASPAASVVEGNIEMEIVIPPMEQVAGPALALAPFPLPKIPHRITRTWLFKSSCGEIPTLPAVAFQAVGLGHGDQLLALLHRNFSRKAAGLPAGFRGAMSNPGLVETMRKIRCIFLEDPSLRDQLLRAVSDGATNEQERNNLHALVNMYSGGESAAIDFYGPPFTIPTLSYFEVLREGNADDLEEMIAGRVVFVGAARESWSNQKDGFFTVFSQADGLDISGVELAATVFSNLTENRAVHHPTTAQSLGLIALFALAAGLVCFLLPPPASAGVLLGGGAVSFALAYLLFKRSGVWFPLIIPLLLVPMSAFLAATLANYFSAQRGHRHVSRALGYYLPGDVVEQLSQDLAFISCGEKMVYSTCLITDAQHYTALSERMSPEELSLHMKEYYRHLFGAVKKRDGIVCNVIGDSMLAHWPASGPESHLGARACRAALDVARAAERFNAEHCGRRLPTRIGLHAGFLLLDNIGAEDHYEYAPVGDIVNTVSRIEELNKKLATHILASQAVLEGVQGLAVREMGEFRLGGKTRAVTIFELLSDNEVDSQRNRLYQDAFPEALLLFRSGKWHQALAAFDQCLLLDAMDGPSRFYRQTCEAFLLDPPAGWQGILKVEK